MNKLLYLSLLAWILTGCNPSTTPTLKKTPISGRGERAPIYQAAIPVGWHSDTPSMEDPILDTRMPLCSFTIDEGLTLTVYNFPTDSLEEQIPPRAQVERWKRQLNLKESALYPVAWGGFSGLRLEGKGILAWSLVIAPEHYRALSLPREEQVMRVQKQMRADITLKATGPQELIDKHKNTLMQFASSFELIEGIAPHT